MGDSNDTSVKLITLDNLETYHGLMDTKKEEHSVELTQAQYDALSPAEKMNGKTYYITDADPEYGSGYATADSVAPVEENSTSSADYAVDDYIYRSGKLYKVIAAISIGDSFVVNTNIRETRISDEFGSGGDPESVDYNSVENKPQINGVTLSGNKTGSDLGLVNAVSGKGLSTNDYSNADKAIVDGVTSALAGKADIADVPTKTSDLTNDSNFVVDANYVHTMNNYTNIDQSKLAGITSGATRNIKKEYTLDKNSWVLGNDGYYQTLTLNPMLDSTYPVNVKLSTTGNGNSPTDDEIYAYNGAIYGGDLQESSVEDEGATAVLIYADYIPTSKYGGTMNLKIWVEGIVKEVQ